MTDSAASPCPRRAQQPQHAGEWHLFLTLVSLATLLPFAIAPLAAHTTLGGEATLYIYGALLFVGSSSMSP